MSTALTCPRCGEPLAPGARYCTRCGNDVSGEQAGLATVQMAPRTPPADPQADLASQLRQATIGEFEIAGELGRGGMATVYLAHDIALNRKVAIKVMNPSLVGTGAQMVERFRREARTAAALSHPHIIPIYAVRETPFIFFVMKYVQGRSLDAIVKSTGPLPIPMIQTILHQAGGAIDYAHRQGTIHRDIKPANIMLDEDGWAVVTDFGIAKGGDSQNLTMTGVTVGTPSYMSPEQCAAKPVTAASDQYSLGIVAYEMLTGSVPFHADTVMGVMWQHFNDAPRPIREIRPDCPLDIEAAVLRMLAKKAEERFASVEEAIDSIGAPTLRRDDPIRRQMKALAREGAGAEVLARVHTPESPIPKASTPAPAPPAARTPPPGTEAPTVISDPRIAQAPTERTPVPATPPASPSITEAATVRATPIHPEAPPRTPPPRTVVEPAPAPTRTPPAAPPPEPRRPAPRRRSPLPAVLGIFAVAAVGAGGWYLFGRSGDRSPAAPGDSVTAPAPPAPVATVTLAPTPTSIVVGNTVQLAATLTDAQGGALSGREIQWVSGDSSVAAVSPGGLVTGRAAGNATVTATSEGRSGAATVIVTTTVTPVATVAITPSAPTVELGDTLTLVAAPQDARGNTLSGRTVTWSTSAPNVATVTSAGVVAGLREGAATITAVAEGKRGTVRLGVAPPSVATVLLDPTSVTLTPGERGQLSAVARDRRGNALTGRTTAWASSDEDVVLVTSSGSLRAMRAGRATITARIDGVGGTATVLVGAVPVASVALSQPPANFAVGATAQLSATVRDAQGGGLDDRRVTWTSSNPAVARVSPTGQITAVAAGTATIRAESEGRQATVSLTVVAPPGAVVGEAAGVAAAPETPPAGPGPANATAAAALPRRAVAAGGQHSCGVTGSGGVSCWGSNTASQLGDAGSGQQLSAAALLSSPSGVTALAAGAEHTCALLQNGSAVCWGQNRNGQLGGRGTGLVTVAGGRTYRELSAGARHTCGIAADGQLWCWGDNGSGQLGDGSTRGGATPRLVKGGQKYRAVAAGGTHTCAVTQAGGVQCWGDGFSGQLGRGIRETQTEPVDVRTPVPATAIASGAKHSCALGRNGTVYCWGENRYGEIGDGSKSERSEPVAVSGRMQFTAITAGWSQTCGLTAAGEAYCWGDNRQGQVGDGTRNAREQPTKVAGGPYRSLSAGAAHTCAISQSGEAFCWGGNARGQVGDGTTEMRPAPTPVTAR